MLTVKEVCDLTGVSARTLHYYDEVKVLKPTNITEAGHRMYSNKDVMILQQILLFKELGMSLKYIKQIMGNADYDIARVLQGQKKLLKLKRNRLEYLIGQIEAWEIEGVYEASRQMDFKEQASELIWNEIYEEQGVVQSNVLPTVVEFAKQLKKEGAKKVLDLGCGTGRHTIYLAEQGFEVVATDISEKGLAVTKSRVDKLGLKIERACHDMRSIPFKDNTFDAVLCSWVSGHGTYEEVVEHANEMVRVVKEGGLIFADYPSIEDEDYGVGIEIEKNTFIENREGEEKIPHHYSDCNEIRNIYSGHDIEVESYTYHYYYPDQSIHDIKAIVAHIRKAKQEMK